MQVTIDGKVYQVEASLLSQLPQPVLLGRDVSSLPQLVQKEVTACMVLTKVRRKAVEEEEARLIGASREAEASTRPILSVKEKFREMATGLDEGLFQGGEKVRRNRKERQLAKRTFKLFGDQNSRSAQIDESDTSAGSRAQVPSLEGDPASIDELEVEVGSEDVDVDVAVERFNNCPTVVGIDELKRLQRERHHPLSNSREGGSKKRTLLLAGRPTVLSMEPRRTGRGKRYRRGSVGSPTAVSQWCIATGS
jgi:hypothetical protein